MGSLIQTYTLAATAARLRNRITAAIMEYAHDILMEDATGAAQQKRIAWSHWAFANWQVCSHQLMWAILSHEAVNDAGEQATDDQIRAAVAGVIEMFVVQGAPPETTTPVSAYEPVE